MKNLKTIKRWGRLVFIGGGGASSYGNQNTARKYRGSKKSTKSGQVPWGRGGVCKVEIQNGGKVYELLEG